MTENVCVHILFIFCSPYLRKYIINEVRIGLCQAAAAHHGMQAEDILFLCNDTVKSELSVMDFFSLKMPYAIL